MLTKKLKTYISLRVINGYSIRGVINALENGIANFDDNHDLCDKILPLKDIFLRDDIQQEINDFKSQLAFEKSRELTADDIKNGWNKEYKQGYVDGLKQGVARLKCFINL